MTNGRIRWALAIVTLVAYSGCSTAAPQPIPGVEQFSDLSREHQTGPIAYAQVPPVGGAHNPIWLNCGVYEERVPNEFAVHALEHGAVWVTYQPTLPSDQVEQLRRLVRGKDFVLLSPWGTDPPLRQPIVASAWGLQLQVESASDPRLAEFIKQFANGPQNPEPRAPCSRGVGGPGTPLPSP
jgi:hypothetical protein